MKFSLLGAFGITGEESIGSDGKKSLGTQEAFIASGSEDGAIVIWDVKSKEVLQRLEGEHEGPVFGVDVNSRGTGTSKNMLVSCGMDGKVVMWKVEEEEMNGEREYRNGDGNGEDMDEEYPLENGHMDEDVAEDYRNGDDMVDTPTADTPRVKEEDVGDDLMAVDQAR